MKLVPILFMPYAIVRGEERETLLKCFIDGVVMRERVRAEGNGDWLF